MGRGCPWGIKDGRNILVAIYTESHTGGKFDKGGYKNSSGLNGIGGTAVCMSSEYFSVSSCRDGKIAIASFEKGNLVDYNEVDNVNKVHTGTLVTFKPDKEVFKNMTDGFSYERICDEIKKMEYRMNYQKTYNPKIVKLIAGIQSAHAGLFSFFYFLKNNSNDYSSDLNFIRQQLGLDEILVRCCGFHKISSVCDKTITTSCIRYEEELGEYIKRGWNIDFVKPIILNPSTKRLEEYSDEFLLIKKMHFR